MNEQRHQAGKEFQLILSTLHAHSLIKIRAYVWHTYDSFYQKFKTKVSNFILFQPFQSTSTWMLWFLMKTIQANVFSKLQKVKYFQVFLCVCVSWEKISVTCIQTLKWVPNKYTYIAPKVPSPPPPQPSQSK